MDISAQSNPIQLFEQWLQDAKNSPGVREPTAMTLATLAADGSVNARIVLCKEWSARGLAFYTNYLSRKGHDIEKHAQVGAVFFWDALMRQVLVNGSVQKLSAQESDEYWQSRPRESQLSQYISKQSQGIESRATLERAWHQAEKEFAGREIPRPQHWGGYLIEPTRIEFWVGQPGRLHDRFEFEKSKAIWTFRRLSP